MLLNLLFLSKAKIIPEPNTSELYLIICLFSIVLLASILPWAFRVFIPKKRFRYNFVVIGFSYLHFITILFFIGLLSYGLFYSIKSIVVNKEIIQGILKGVEFMFIASIPYFIIMAFKKTIINSFSILTGISEIEDIKSSGLDIYFAHDAHGITEKKDLEDDPKIKYTKHPMDFTIDENQAKKFFISGILGVVLTNTLEIILKWVDRDPSEIVLGKFFYWEFNLFNFIIPIILLFILSWLLIKYYNHLNHS